MPKIKPCSLGSRHKWEWHKTVRSASFGKNYAVMGANTMYKCQCGETKIAALDPNTQFYENLKKEKENDKKD